VALILNISPENLPVHQITIVGVATATDSAIVNDVGVQIKCIVSDYLSREKQAEFSITLFHPPGSRFINQTTIAKRGSTIFFSGALTVIYEKLYVELHNFSFIRTNQASTSTSSKQMPWSSKPSKTPNNPTMSMAEIIHNLKQPTAITQNVDCISGDQNFSGTNSLPPSNEPPTPEQPIQISPPKSFHKNHQQPLTPTSKKRTTRSSACKTKTRRLSDIASDIITMGEDTGDVEYNENNDDDDAEG
jgi:hypothetical protein